MLAIVYTIALHKTEKCVAGEPDLKHVGEVLDEGAGLLPSVENDRRVVAGKLQAEIEAGLSAARKLMASNPALAEQNLKFSLDVLDAAPVDAEIRSRLRQQVTTAIRQARQRRTQLDHEVAAAQERQAAAAELERVNAALTNNQQRQKQIVDRFDALLNEQRYAVADEQVRPVILQLAPDSPIDASITFGGNFQRTVHENEQTWRQRQHEFTRSLALVEQSLIPFADEPPIVYVPAEQWLALTERREKYKAVDLGKRGGAEQRIFDELNRTATIDVVEMSLKDVVTYLSDTHGIPIVLSSKKLDEAGVSVDTPVTKSLRGITLRSALRLLLKDLELTYVVRDEVLQITTPEDAESQLITKVYPVGDLVVPISNGANLFGQGGGITGGGLNGLSGGFGGGGLGGGGLGGGGFGGGGGGFGAGGAGGIF